MYKRVTKGEFKEISVKETCLQSENLVSTTLSINLQGLYSNPLQQDQNEWGRIIVNYYLILIYYPTKIWVAVRLPLEVFHDLTFGLFYHLYTELKYMHTITTTCLPHIDCTRKIHFILELCTSLFIIHFILFKNHTYIFWCSEYKTKMKSTFR